MLKRLFRDQRGSSLIEFTLVFPVVIAAAFGTVDVTYMLYEWAQVSKATTCGARYAAVSAPAATAVAAPAYTPATIGQSCFDPATGASAGICPTFNEVCTSAGGCNGYSAANFNNIVARMSAVTNRIQPANVQISYRTTGLGFSGRPNGLPMTITVRTVCLTHRMFFLNAIAGWAFGVPQGCPAGTQAGPLMSFETTVPSEDIAGNEAFQCG